MINRSEKYQRKPQAVLRAENSTILTGSHFWKKMLLRSIDAVMVRNLPQLREDAKRKTAGIRKDTVRI